MDQRPRRVSNLGIAPGHHVPGARNAITDVRSVRAGHTTVDDGAGIRTGVTAVVPDALDTAGGRLPEGSLRAGTTSVEQTAAVTPERLGDLIGRVRRDELDEIDNALRPALTLD